MAYHTDGCNYDIIPDLIEIGLDVLNPIQTECRIRRSCRKNMEISLLLRGMAVQSTLPMGTPEQIEKEYAWLKNSVGKGGGWIFAPTHHVQLDAPMENFFHLLKTVGTIG